MAPCCGARRPPCGTWYGAWGSSPSRLLWVLDAAREVARVEAKELAGGTAEDEVPAGTHAR